MDFIHFQKPLYMYINMAFIHIFFFIFQPKTDVPSESEDIQVAREGLENLTVCIALSPPTLDALDKESAWKDFIIDLLLLCKTRYLIECFKLP